jgi:hypothetical protein
VSEVEVDLVSKEGLDPVEEASLQVGRARHVLD